MRSETAQMCRLVISARKALAYKQPMEEMDLSYLSSVEITFLANRNIPPVTGEDASAFVEWLKVCRWWGLLDVKLMLPAGTDDQEILGFENSERGVIVCFWRSGDVTYFAPDWVPDRDRQGWNVSYQEYAWEDHPEKITYEDCTEDFMTVLKEIGELADRISERTYADKFLEAYDLLDLGLEGAEYPANAPEVPESFQKIFMAVLKADVLGSADSWNDGPAYSAARQGQEADYEELTSRLAEQLNLNLMYVVNECWEKPKED